MTRDDLKHGLSSVKMYWPQWRERLEKPGAEAIMLRFWIRLKAYSLRHFEDAIITWVETRNTTPTIDSLVDLTETCYRAWKRGQAMEAQGRNRVSNKREPVTDGVRTVEELAWAKFHCEMVEMGLHLRTAQRAKALADLYIKLGERIPSLAEECERQSYLALQLSQDLSRHPEREWRGVPPSVVGAFEHASPDPIVTEAGQEDLRL